MHRMVLLMSLWRKYKLGLLEKATGALAGRFSVVYKTNVYCDIEDGEIVSIYVSRDLGEHVEVIDSDYEAIPTADPRYSALIDIAEGPEWPTWEFVD